MKPSDLAYIFFVFLIDFSKITMEITNMAYPS
ncbi:hypothetical protein KCTC52924_03765 [Arenibacter antarcticus]